jgi:NTE family protein
VRPGQQGHGANSNPRDRALVSRHPKQILIDLALQGGGAHGAFTWGVLDRLLEERWLCIDGISGTSAGAMNAAVLAHGFVRGGAAGARKALEQFWLQVSEAALLSPFRRTPFDVLLGRWTLDNSPVFMAADLMARMFSPYDLNPMGTNPPATSSQPVLTSPAWPIAPSSSSLPPRVLEPGEVECFAAVS